LQFCRTAAAKKSYYSGAIVGLKQVGQFVVQCSDETMDRIAKALYRVSGFVTCFYPVETVMSLTHGA